MSNTTPSALDALMIKIVAAQGTVIQPTRPTLNLADPRFAVVDNPTNPAGPSTDVTLQPSVSLVPLGAGGTITLTPAQYVAGYLLFTGTLPNNTTVVLPSAVVGKEWVLDLTGVTFSAHTVTFQTNALNWATTFSASGMARVVTNGTRLYGSTLTP